MRKSGCYDVKWSGCCRRTILSAVPLPISAGIMLMWRGTPGARGRSVLDSSPRPDQLQTIPLDDGLRFGDSTLTGRHEEPLAGTRASILAAVEFAPAEEGLLLAAVPGAATGAIV